MAEVTVRDPTGRRADARGGWHPVSPTGPVGDTGCHHPADILGEVIYVHARPVHGSVVLQD